MKKKKGKIWLSAWLNIFIYDACRLLLFLFIGNAPEKEEKKKISA